MKTFESFLYEGISDKLGSMSDEDFANFQKGRTAAEAENFRKARDKKRSALAVKKKEDATGLGAKPKEKEGFNKQRAASGPAGGVRTPLTYSKKKEEEDKKEKEKDRKKLDLKKPLGWAAEKAKDAGVGLLKTNTKTTVPTYAAQ